MAFDGSLNSLSLWLLIVMLASGRAEAADNERPNVLIAFADEEDTNCGDRPSLK